MYQSIALSTIFNAWDRSPRLILIRIKSEMCWEVWLFFFLSRILENTDKSGKKPKFYVLIILYYHIIKEEENKILNFKIITIIIRRKIWGGSFFFFCIRAWQWYSKQTFPILLFSSSLTILRWEWFSFPLQILKYYFCKHIMFLEIMSLSRLD